MRDVADTLQAEKSNENDISTLAPRARSPEVLLLASWCRLGLRLTLDQRNLLSRVSMRTSSVPIVLRAKSRMAWQARGARFLKVLKDEGRRGGGEAAAAAGVVYSKSDDPRGRCAAAAAWQQAQVDGDSEAAAGDRGGHTHQQANHHHHNDQPDLLLRLSLSGGAGTDTPWTRLCTLTVYSRLTTSSGRGRFSRLDAGAAFCCFLVFSLPILNLSVVCVERRPTINDTVQLHPRAKGQGRAITGGLVRVVTARPRRLRHRQRHAMEHRRRKERRGGGSGKLT